MVAITVEKLYYMNTQNFQLELIDNNGDVLTNNFGGLSKFNLKYNKYIVEWVEFDEPDYTFYDFKVIAHVYRGE